MPLILIVIGGVMIWLGLTGKFQTVISEIFKGVTPSASQTPQGNSNIPQTSGMGGAA